MSCFLKFQVFDNLISLEQKRNATNLYVDNLFLEMPWMDIFLLIFFEVVCNVKICKGFVVSDLENYCATN